MQIKSGGSQKNTTWVDPHGFSVWITARCGIYDVSCLLLWCYESVGYYYNTTQATYHCWHDLKLGVAMIWALLHWPCVFQQFAEITKKKSFLMNLQQKHI